MDKLSGVSWVIGWASGNFLSDGGGTMALNSDRWPAKSAPSLMESEGKYSLAVGYLCLVARNPSSSTSFC